MVIFIGTLTQVLECGVKICQFGLVLTLFMEIYKMDHIFARIDEKCKVKSFLG